MIISRLNRTGQEKVFMSAVNVQGATITTGYGVAYALGASNDGASVLIATGSGANAPGFIGVALKDVANNDVGLFQIAGFVNSVLISNAGTSITIAAGEPLVPAPAGFYSAAPTYANAGFRWIAMSNAPVAVSAVAYGSGLIRMI